MMIVEKPEKDIFSRKIESFKRVLSGETYQSIANEYGVSGSVIRQNVMQVMRLIRERIADHPEQLRSWGIDEARQNKYLWLVSLDKALDMVSPYKIFESDIKRRIDDFILETNYTLRTRDVLVEISRDIRRLCLEMDSRKDNNNNHE